MILLKIKTQFYYKSHDEINHLHYHENITNILIKVYNKINGLLKLYFLIPHILYIVLLKNILLLNYLVIEFLHNLWNF